MKINFSQKGVSLYLALMVMTVLLAIALGVNTILVSQIKMIKGMENSVIAFYAADTGIEKILYDASQGIDIIADCPESNPCQDSLGNNASFSIVVLPNGESGCSATDYCIKSVGSFYETQRAIQITR